jgi:hypothetical protein
MATHTVPTGTRKNVNVHRTPAFRDDLAILTRNGASEADAIRAAVQHMADAYRRAWDYGDVAEGTDPVITGCTYSGELRPGAPAPVGGSDA